MAVKYLRNKMCFRLMNLKKKRTYILVLAKLIFTSFCSILRIFGFLGLVSI